MNLTLAKSDLFRYQMSNTTYSSPVLNCLYTPSKYRNERHWTNFSLIFFLFQVSDSLEKL